MVLLLAGNAAAAGKIPIDARLAEDDACGAIHFARRRVAAGIDVVGYLQAGGMCSVHADHAPSTSRSVEPDYTFTRPEPPVQLDEVEGAPVVVFFDLPGDLFQLGGRVVEFASDFDAEIGLAVHGVVVDGDAAVGSDQLSIGRQDQWVDLGGSCVNPSCKPVEFREDVAQ